MALNSPFPPFVPTLEEQRQFGAPLSDDVNPDDQETSRAEEERLDPALRSRGLMTTSELKKSSATVEAMLKQAGVDVNAFEVQSLLQNAAFREMLTGPMGGAAIANLAETYPAVPAQAYDQALAQSGFSGDFAQPQAAPGAQQLAAREGFAVADLKPGVKLYEENPDTGWIRYKNGVLVSPDGQVAFDPTSSAPGSLKWQREVVSGWGSDKVEQWADRLVEFGYLSKEQAKKASSSDPGFLGALQSYHMNRYVYGKPVSGELTGVGAAGADKPPLVDFEEMQAQTRNFVREQYRRVFGEDPTDGEVAAFSDQITRQAMTLQKRFRRQEMPGFSGMAATEAEERFVERLEQSPEATFLRESDEENTRLRDAMQQAVVVTNSLGS